MALIGDRLYVSRWSTAALLMALTLRHRIARTGVNTYESCFHPRVLTFAIGLVAVGLFLRGRRVAALTLARRRVPGAPDDRRVVRDLDGGGRGGRGVAVARRAVAWSSAPWCRALIAARVWPCVASGALADRLAVMDAPWLAAFESRDYLFPADDWKPGTWLTHLLPSLRHRRGVAVAPTRSG